MVNAMASWDDVSRLALALPSAAELTDTNGLKWVVRHKHFAHQELAGAFTSGTGAEDQWPPYA